MPSQSSLLRLAAGVAIAAAVQSCSAKGPTVEINGRTYTIEIAEDDASRARGLMERDSMPADHGMLFVFQDDAPRAFWMKNCRFPQDMLFFDSQRRLISVQRDVPPCVADPCPAYSSGAPARYVLELNAGQADAIGVHPGDELAIRR